MKEVSDLILGDVVKCSDWERRKVICVDMDSTLVDVSSCQAFLKSKPRNWNAFFEGVKLAPSYFDIELLVKSLISAGHEWLVTTARSEDHRDLTMKWLESPPRSFVGRFAPAGGYFRPTNDYRKDVIVKLEMLERIRSDGYEPWLWIDDKEDVVKALHAEGVRVLQVFTDYSRRD